MKHLIFPSILGLGVVLAPVYGCASSSGQASSNTPDSALNSPDETPVPPPADLDESLDEKLVDKPGADDTSAKQPLRHYGLLQETLSLKSPAEVISTYLAVHTLPRVEPQNYKQWRMRKQINVGVGYLDQAGLLTSNEAFVVSNEDLKIRVYDLQTGKQKSSVEIPGAKQFQAAFFVPWAPTPDANLRGAPDLTLLFGSNAGLSVLDPTTAERLKQISNEPAWDLRWTREGSILGAINTDLSTQSSKLRFYDQSLKVFFEVQGKERIDDWSLSADGKLLAVTYYPSDSVEVIDISSGKLLLKVPSPPYSNSVDISPDGEWVATSGGFVELIRINNPEEKYRFMRFKNNVHQVRFSPSGDALVASAYDGQARILSLPKDPKKSTELHLEKLLPHLGTANVYRVEFTQDGSGLLTSSGDKTLRYWGK